MTFQEYLLFIFIGTIIGAVLGRRFMRWAWHDATVVERENIGWWIALAIAGTYIGVRRYW